MKKFLFVAAAAIAFMSSCSEEEILNEAPKTNGNTIAFSTIENPRTRAGVTATTLDGFTVTCLNPDKSVYFGDTEFTYDSQESLFKSTIPYYWPLGSTLNFYAISHPGTKSVDANNVPHYGYNDWAGETDLVAATVLDGEKKVPYVLNFQHILSQIYVSAESADKMENLTYKLVSVDMTTACTGVYSFADASAGIGTWEIDNEQEKTYSFAESLPLSCTKSTYIAPLSTYWNVLPMKEGKLKFKVGYQVFQNDKMISDFTGDNAKTCVVENPNLLSGRRYVYSFKLTNTNLDIITFQLNMQDWGMGGTTVLTPARYVESITLNRDEMRIFTTQSRPLTVESVLPEDADNKDYTWHSLNEDVATVSEDGIVTGVTPGETEVFAIASDGSNTKAICKVTVTLLENNGRSYIDLGLPSGTLWAGYNVGWTSNDPFGAYFAYGETETKEQYSADTYIFKPEAGSTMYTKYNAEDGLKILEVEDDAVRKYYGGAWIMPSSKEWNELLTYCSSGGYQSANIPYIRFSSKINSAKVSFPLKSVYRVDYGWTQYITANKYAIRLSDGNVTGDGYLNGVARYYGLPVRGCLIP